jgi:hypothetical protein
VTEATFKKVFANIKPPDAVEVGLHNKYIDQYTSSSECTRCTGQTPEDREGAL